MQVEGRAARGGRVGTGAAPAAFCRHWRSSSSLNETLEHDLHAPKSPIGAVLAAALVAASAAALAQGTATPPATPGDARFVTVQPQGEWLASLFIGQPVTNQAGETVGDVNDVLFDKAGRISTVVIGV